MKKFAVFDIDGTLIRWQLYHTMVDRLAEEGMLGPDAQQQFKEARMKWKRREELESFREYEMVLVKTFEGALEQIDTKTFDRLVGEVMEEYKHQTYRFTRQLLKDLKEKGYFLIAISGSHHELVAHMAKEYGFDEFIGSKYSRKNGKFTGEKTIASLIKGELLKEIIKTQKLTLKDSYAIGDSKGDTPILEMVENPIAFNPDRRLFTTAEGNGWKIVLERKNMIYELEKTNDKYQLRTTL